MKEKGATKPSSYNEDVNVKVVGISERRYKMSITIQYCKPGGVRGMLDTSHTKEHLRAGVCAPATIFRELSVQNRIALVKALDVVDSRHLFV